MGNLSSAEYETQEVVKNGTESSVLQTSTALVEHNGKNGLKTDRLSIGQSQAIGPAADMANELLTQPQTDSEATTGARTGHELDSFLGKAFEEKPVWKTLYENIRDVFFPVKLPPLELTSKPIPVPDRMAVKANPWAIGISSTVNLTILLLVLYFVGKQIVETVKPSLIATNINVGDYNSPKDATKAGGGGGGGDRSIIDANKGKLPQKSPDPITPPQPQTIEHPKLPDLPAINVQANIQLPDNPSMPMIGVHESAN